MRSWLLDGYFSLSQRVRFGTKIERSGPSANVHHFTEIKTLYPPECHGGRNPKNSKMLFELDLGADLMVLRENLIRRLTALDTS